MPVIAINGVFQNWRALLASIMEDDEVSGLVVITLRKDGGCGYGHINVSRAEMAYASLLIAEKAMEEWA